MLAKQVTVFIENREGRLCEVLEILKENDINVVGASIADTSDFGLFRMIVNEPQKACDALKAGGIMSKLTDIISVVVPHKAGSLEKVLKVINEAGINIEYMYGMSSQNSDAAIAIKTEDLEATQALLEKHKLTE